MNILEVTYNSPMEVFLNRHTSTLNENGLKVTTVARHSENLYSRSASIGELTPGTLIMPNFDRADNYKKIAFVAKYFSSKNQIPHGLKIRERVLINYFSQLQPGLIHFHFASLAVLLAWIPIQLKIPFTFSLRGSDIQTLPFIQKGYIESLTDLFKTTSGVHSVCDALWESAQDIVEIPSPPYHRTIYTTVPVADEYSAPANNRVIVPRFVTVGRLHYTKGLTNLLKAIREYKDQVGPIQLTIIGDGPERETVQMWIHQLALTDNVKLHSKKTPEQVKEIISKADAYIQSSILEGFSNATAEAMGIGLPVFATDVGGTNEVINNGVNGYLLDPFEPEKWYQVLSAIYHRDRMNSIGKMGWETAKSAFSSRNHATQFIEFYDHAHKI